MRLLYPSDPFDAKQPDSAFAEEFLAAQSARIPVSLFASENLSQGEFRPRPSFEASEQILYRGWMLTPQEYGTLHAAILRKGAGAITSAEDYRSAHYLPEWYSLCVDMTPRTVVLQKNADFEAALADLGWSKFFVKDYVKSLTTKRGSIARLPSEVGEIVSEIEKYRGHIEGGVCVREYEALRSETEERYFALLGKVYGRDGTAIPREVLEIARRVARPFISIDVAERNDGVLRLIEVGDGQVSDRKKWSAQRFVEMLSGELGNRAS